MDLGDKTPSRVVKETDYKILCYCSRYGSLKRTVKQLKQQQKGGEIESMDDTPALIFNMNSMLNQN